MQNDKNYRQD